MARLDLVNLLCLRADGLKQWKRTNGVSWLADGLKQWKPTNGVSVALIFSGFLWRAAVCSVRRCRHWACEVVGWSRTEAISQLLLTECAARSWSSTKLTEFGD